MEGDTDLLPDITYRISDSKRADKLMNYVKVTVDSFENLAYF